MAWGTPTIVHRRGRMVRHTQITISGTLNGTVDTLTTVEVPWGVYAGMVQAKSFGGTNAEVVRIRIKSFPVGLTDTYPGVDLYGEDLTIASDPDFFPIKSFFEEVGAPTTANQIGAFCLPSNRLRFFMDHAPGVSTTDTVTVWVGLLSHVLDQ